MGHFKEHDDFSKRRGDGDMIFRKKGYLAFVFFFGRLQFFSQKNHV
jgi:hypothetical protein